MSIKAGAILFEDVLSARLYCIPIIPVSGPNFLPLFSVFPTQLPIITNSNLVKDFFWYQDRLRPEKGQPNPTSVPLKTGPHVNQSLCLYTGWRSFITRGNGRRPRQHRRPRR